MFKKVLNLSVVAAFLFSAAFVTSCGKDDNTTTEYTVKFDPDGGTPAPADQKIAEGGKVTEPNAMTKTNHTFDGWYKDAGKWDFATGIVTSDMTLKAKWTPAGEATRRYETVPYTGKASQSSLKAGGKLDNLVFNDYDDQYNYYFFVLGHVNSTPLAYRPAIYYNGTTPITVGYSSSNVTETSISNSVTEANENSVTKSSSTTWNNKVGVTAGIEGGTAFLKAKFEASYERSWGGSESTDVTTARSFSNTYETSNTKASEITDEISVTIGNNNEPTGLYRFSLFSVTDVYFVVITDRAKTEIKSAEISYCARPTQYWALDYEPKQGGNFGKTASGTLLQIPDLTVSELPDIAECEHEWNSWEILQDATNKTEGEKRRTCMHCGREETQVIPVIRTGTFNLSTGTWIDGDANGKATFKENTLTVNDQAEIIVTMDDTGSAINKYIVVNGNAIITLKDVKLKTTYGPIRLTSGAKLTIRLEGNNELTASGHYAGIQTTGAELTITGPGSLTANGGKDGAQNGSGAGIGGNGGKFDFSTASGNVGGTGGTVIIESGTVTANGGNASDASLMGGGLEGIGVSIGGGGAGAGIGGGGGTAWYPFITSQKGGAGGNITIHAGANVTANGGKAGKDNLNAHGGGPAMSYGGGGGGGTNTTTPKHSDQGDPGTIVDKR